MDGIVFEDIFYIEGVNLEENLFDNVDRLHCVSEEFKADLILDINKNLFPMKAGDKFRLMIATTLQEDGIDHGSEFIPNAHIGTRADKFDYVMYGKCYEPHEGDSEFAVNMKHVPVPLVRVTLDIFHLVDY